MESQLETENVCSLSKRKKEPKFKINTYFNSNVIWRQLEYKMSTLDHTIQKKMLLIARVTIFLWISFVTNVQCDLDQEFKTMVMERIDGQDENILQLKTKNSVLESKLEFQQSRLQENLASAEQEIKDELESKINGFRENFEKQEDFYSYINETIGKHDAEIENINSVLEEINEGKTQIKFFTYSSVPNRRLF